MNDIRNFIAENVVDEIFVDSDSQANYIDEAKHFKLLGTDNLKSW